MGFLKKHRLGMGFSRKIDWEMGLDSPLLQDPLKGYLKGKGYRIQWKRVRE